MLLHSLILALGLGLLLAGGDALVRGAAAFARSLGVSALVVGLTVVAFGTSAPELAVNLRAVGSGSGAIAFGNVFGSNLANIGLIVGLSAVIHPLPIRSILIRRELPMLLLATAASLALASDLALSGAPDVYTRGDGLILLLFFAVFLYYTTADLRHGRQQERGDLENDEGILADVPLIPRGRAEPLLRNLLLMGAGLLGLIAGAHFTIEGATALARALAIPEVVIALSVIAIGTSLPELVTALLAIRLGNNDLALGGIVGSNIFNTLLITGLSAALRPLPVPTGGHLDLAATAVLTLSFMLTASTHRRHIIRYEGLLLLLLYFGYIGWRFFALPVVAG